MLENGIGGEQGDEVVYCKSVLYACWYEMPSGQGTSDTVGSITMRNFRDDTH